MLDYCMSSFCYGKRAIALAVCLAFIGVWSSLRSDIMMFEVASEQEETKNTPKVWSVDCGKIQPIHPINIGKMDSNDKLPYLVSFSWWDRRIHKPDFATGETVPANPSVFTIQTLLQNTTAGSALVDVGANVGFMTMYAVNLHRPVYAIDPISYNIAKLCEGFKANVEKGWAHDDNLHLYHAAAGPSHQERISITRPSDKVGKFDQSSLSRNAVYQSDVTTESIPMIAIDSIVPAELPVGVVKIDVQGHEYGVLLGMKELLSRTTGYPTHIFYEDVPGMIKAAGYEPGACQRLLQEHGYKCTHVDHDILCTVVSFNSVRSFLFMV